MSNSLLTLNMITKKALSLFINSNALLQTVRKTYDDSFGVAGAKIGSTLRLRLPNDPTVRVGATSNPQSIAERNTTITVGTMLGVDLGFTSTEMALSISDFSERYLETSINNLAGAVASDVMNVAETVPNIVHNVDGSNNTISPTASTWLAAGAILDSLSCPRGSRKAILDPLTSARTVQSMLGLFNPSPEISKQFRAGSMDVTSGTLGINDWRNDQTVIKHVQGASTYGTVAAGGVTNVSATGCTIATSALAGAVNVGDILTIATVNSVNRVTKASNHTLAQFVVTSAATTGATSLTVYPALIGPASGVAVSYQTVDNVPATGAAIASPINANEVYRKNMVFVPEAFALVTADLALPSGAVMDAHREMYDGISLRCIRDYLFLSDTQATRIDILYGWAAPRPEFAVIVADSV